MSAAYPISPELALVCPELRREGLATLPDVDPEWLFRPARMRRPLVPVPPAPAPERDVSFVVATALYFGLNVAHWLVWGSTVFGAVTLVTLILTLAG